MFMGYFIVFQSHQLLSIAYGAGWMLLQKVGEPCIECRNDLKDEKRTI